MDIGQYLPPPPPIVPGESELSTRVQPSVQGAVIPVVRQRDSQVYDTSPFHACPLFPPLRFLRAHSPGVDLLHLSRGVFLPY